MESLSNSWVARLTTHTLWGFPINEIVHILSVSVIVGIVVLCAANNLMGRRIANNVLRSYVKPLFATGFAIALVTGFIFFAAWPDRYLGNTAFLIKLPLLVALIAVSAFIWRDRATDKLKKTQILSWLALFLALATIAAGRLIAYV